ncbi:prepilin-type N-terminal cleavage/methylation domain-containing protein [Elusimicrobium posterum]|uniref:type IV pilin protein n=1 Tax=Elusimicrobium posterum TaxID=3116653 RepID=UPI003C7068CF
MLSKKGFTLIELMVVVLIIAVLAGIAVPQYTSSIEKARATEAIVNAKAIQDSFNRYYAQRERYPSGTTEERLKALDINVELPKYFSIHIYSSSTVNGSVQGIGIEVMRTKNPQFTADWSFSDNSNFYWFSLTSRHGKKENAICYGSLCEQVVACTSNITSNSCNF